MTGALGPAAREIKISNLRKYYPLLSCRGCNFLNMMTLHYDDIIGACVIGVHKIPPIY